MKIVIPLVYYSSVSVDVNTIKQDLLDENFSEKEVEDILKKISEGNQDYIYHFINYYTSNLNIPLECIYPEVDEDYIANKNNTIDVEEY